MKIVAYDTTEKQFPFLSTWWMLGSTISGADARMPVSSWGQLYAKLEAFKGNITHLQIWSHGRPGAPIIAGEQPDLPSLAAALGDHEIEQIWWRSCDVHRGTMGANFAARVVRTLRCESVGHCAVISAPNPLWQARICALRPGETPWWGPIEEDLHGVLLTTMTVPSHAYSGRYGR